MARTRAVPRRRPNINFQQRGNIDFERQRVAATRNISSSESSTASSAVSSAAAASPARSLPARSPARSPLGNLARNLARDIGRNPVPASPPASPIVRPIRRRRRRISESSSASNASAAATAPQRNQARNPPVRRRIRAYDVKIKFVLPRVKDVEVKHNGRVVRKMKVRRVAKHAAKKRNVRYGL